MTRLDEITRAIEQLSAEELAKFRAWYDERAEQLFDERMARDVAAGKLDWLAEEALADERSGRTRSAPGS